MRSPCRSFLPPACRSMRFRPMRLPNLAGGGASQLDSVENAPVASGQQESKDSQHSEIVKLPESSGDAVLSDSAQNSSTPESSADHGSNSSSDPGENLAKSDSHGQAAAEAPLVNEAPKPMAGEIRFDGFSYSVNADGETVSLSGWYGTAPDGSVSIPSEVRSGNDSFAVTRIGVPNDGGRAEGVLADSSITSLSIPASVFDIVDGAFSDCASLSRIAVSKDNESFASFDGMLFSKDLSSLLSVPEGKGGVAQIPDLTTAVPARLFSQCAELSCVEVGEGSTAFASRNGVLYSKDMTTLLAHPVGAGSAIVVPEEVESIASGAFTGCTVTSLAVLGNVISVDSGAFDESAKSAVVALPAGADYDERKAVWEAAGFVKFAEPAVPGATAVPTDSEAESDGHDGSSISGFVFTLLEDYTLSVAWSGSEDPVSVLDVPATAELGGVAYRVSRIASSAFEGRTSLTSVNLPSSIVSIEDAAFAGCSELSTVDLPEGLRSVGSEAFASTKLFESWLPASLRSVGSRAFAGCSELDRIVSLGSFEVAADALAECSGVTVYCPSETAGSWNVGVPAAGNHLAPYGIGLSNEPLILNIGESASIFNGGELRVPEAVQVAYAYSAKPVSVDQDGTVTAKASGASEVSVSLCLEDRELASSSRTVEVLSEFEQSGAMDMPGEDDGDESAEGSVQPSDEDDVQPAAVLASEQINAVAALQASGNVRATIGSALYQTYRGAAYKFKVLEVDDTAKTGTVSVAKSDRASDPALTGAIEVPETVQDGGYTYTVVQVAGGGFGDTEITAAVLPASVTRISSQGFDHCDKLAALPDMPSVKELGWNAFRGCSSITEATLPESLEYMEGLCFESCSGLQSVAIGSNFATLKSSAPLGIGEWLTSLEVASDNPNFRVIDGALCSKDGTVLYDAGAAKSFSSEGLYVVPSGVTKIVGAAFKHVRWLSALVLPESVAAVENSAFDLNTNLTEILSLSGTIALSSDAGSESFKRGSAPTVYCAKAAATQWQALLFNSLDTGVSNVVPLTTGAPTLFGVPEGFEPAQLAVNEVVPVTSQFAVGMSISWGDSDGSLAMLDPSEDGRSVAVTPVAQGTFKAESRLFWTSAFGERLLAAVTTTTVSVSSSHGALPTVRDGLNSDESIAGWSLSADGTLTVSSTEEVADFKWNWDGTGGTNEVHWGSVRAQVRSVDTTGLHSVTSMNCWFKGMPLLSDISKFKIPQGTSSLRDCFTGTRSLEEIPSTFSFPDSVTDVSSMFASAKSLRTLPDTFRLPSNAKFVTHMFDDSALERLPENFAFPVSVTDTAEMFSYCTSLSSLPEKFALPENVKTMSRMFKGCTALSSLPENFKIPESVTGCSDAFQNCPNLTVLPANFSMPEIVTTMQRVFACYSSTPLLYAGSDPVVLGATAWFESQNRTLITPKEASVVFNVSATSGDGWRVLLTKSEDPAAVMAEPDAPEGSGKVFTRWYADKECSKPLDFSKPLSEQTTPDGAGMYQVFGPYVSGSLGDGLPLTKSSSGYAAWSLADDGTFYLRGDGKVASFGWTEANVNASDLHWGPYRDEIKRVVMDPSVRGSGMNYWFYRCRNLTDIREAFIPEEVTSVESLFWACSSLREVPEGFRMPDSVRYAASMFRETPIVSLPSTFMIPSGLTHAQNMFWRCDKLRSLPEGFKFSNPGSLMVSAFSGCTSLRSLPSSFTFPADNLGNLTGRSLPFYCELAPGEARIPTLYTGSDPDVLEYDWESNGRTLVTDASEMEELGAFEATFKVQSPEKDAGFPWQTRLSAWTNRQGFLSNPGDLHLDGYTFSGWCADEACLEPFDFSQPLTEEATLYGKWVLGGGFDAKLPLEDGTTGDVWWRVTADGMLSIEGKGAVVGVGWGVSNRHVGYWGPYRDDVIGIEMGTGVRVKAMPMWFSQMPHLVDLSGFSIPEGTLSVSDLFEDSPAFEKLPDNFRLPDSLENVMGMFSKCSSLKEIPDGFKLGPNIEYANWLFNRCSSLRTLPSGFSIPKNAEVVNNMFSECTLLEALPEGFGFEDPASVRTIAEMFNQCPNLVSLPASFKTAGLTEAAQAKMGLSFKAPGSTPLKTYYAGDPADLYSANDYWKTQNREIVTEVPSGKMKVNLLVSGKDSADGAVRWDLWTTLIVDEGSAFARPSAPGRQDATFAAWRIGSDAGSSTYDFTKTPAENGVVAVDGEFSLYGFYQENRGTLPTIDPDGAQRESAEWEFDSTTGTLAIRSLADGAVIRHLFDDFEGDVIELHWRPLRSAVKRVVVEPGVEAEDLEGWFASMTSLERVQLSIPSSARSVQGLFWGCSSLTTLPEGFTIPDTVTQCNHLFMLCTSLTSLPDGFRLPAAVENEGTPFGLNNLFYGCSSLESLPEGFVLPEVKNGTLSGMFTGCSSLKGLPEGFSLFDVGADVTEAVSTFNGCSSLTSLPDGFRLPPACRVMKNMFNGCTALASLPEGFRFESPEVVSSVEGMFLNCSSLTVLPSSLDLSLLTKSPLWGFETMFALDERPSGDPLPTLYLKGEGSQQADVGKLLAPGRGSGDAVAFWKENFNRELFAEGDAEKPLPSGVRMVTFKTKMAGDTDWLVKRIVLTDGEGKVPDLGVPSKFGYTFSGWCTQESCLASTAFDFVNGRVSEDTVLYGTYAMRATVDVPLQVKVEIDGSGKISEAPVAFVSHAPVAMKVSGVLGELAPGATRLFPREGDTQAVELVVSVGRSSITIAPGSAVEDDRCGGLSGSIAAATPDETSSLSGAVGLRLNGAQVDYQPGEDVTSFARLSWTIEVA